MTAVVPQPLTSQQHGDGVIDAQRSGDAAGQDPVASDRLFSVLFVTAAGLLEAGWIVALVYLATRFL